MMYGLSYHIIHSLGTSLLRQQGDEGNKLGTAITSTATSSLCTSAAATCKAANK
jgi:hypothetical protein